MASPEKVLAYQTDFKPNKAVYWGRPGDMNYAKVFKAIETDNELVTEVWISKLSTTSSTTEQLIYQFRELYLHMVF